MNASLGPFLLDAVSVGDFPALRIVLFLLQVAAKTDLLGRRGLTTATIVELEVLGYLDVGDNIFRGLSTTEARLFTS